MRGRKLSSILLSIVGFLAILLGILTIPFGLRANPTILMAPQSANICAESFLRAINEGNITAMASFLPDSSVLGSVPEDSDPIVALLWDTFRTHLSARKLSDLYSTADGLAMDIELTSLDVEDAVAQIGTLAVNQMQARVAAASDMKELYGKDGQYRSDLVEETLQQAALEVLMGDLATKSTNITLNLSQSEKGWLVIPDQALINALSGKI